MGMAAPDYLKDAPIRLREYMEAERFARQNRQGGFGNTFAPPEAARAGKGEPWADARAGDRGNSEAVFFDDPTPLQGLRPEIENGYIAIWQDMASRPEDLLACARSNGFKIDPAARAKHTPPARNPASSVSYESPPSS